MTNPGCPNYPTCGCEYDFACDDYPRKRGCWPTVLVMVIAWFIVIGVVQMFLWATRAEAHDALPTAAQPQGWKYPHSCCSGVDCRRVATTGGKPITRGVNGPTVAERPEGYVISTTGEVIAYGDIRLKDSPDGEFHWCSVAVANDSRTICLFIPPRSY